MRENVERNLTVLSGVESPLRFAEYRDGRVLLVERSLKTLGTLIEERGIEVVMLNPLIGLHSIPENDNAAMNVLVTELKKIAATKAVGMLIAHHDKKNIGGKSIEDAGQDDTRGAGTITTPMRVMLTLRRLTQKDAQRLGIPNEDVPRIIALSKGAKSNYSARDVGSKLFYAHSVQAQNGSDDFAADSTVALAPYKYERRETGIGDEATATVLAALDGDGLVGSDSRHGNWLTELAALSIDHRFGLIADALEALATAAERDADAAERSANALETLAALFASTLGVSDEICQGDNGTTYRAVNYVRSGRGSKGFPCDGDAGPY